MTTAGTYDAIVKLLKNADDIALYCHTNPDGDALSSMLALKSALEKRGKNVSAFCDSPVPAKYMCLSGAETISFPDKKTHALGLSVDCSDIDRLGQCIKSYLSCKTSIAIDHHSTFKRFSDIALVESNAAACAQIVYKLLKHIKAIDKEIAELLFAGLVTDSGCFSYSNVTLETMKIAAELLEYDVDSADVIFKVFKSTSINRFKLKNRALSNAKFICDEKAAYIVFKKDDFAATDTSTADTEGIVSELKDIDSVQIAFALCEVGQHSYKLSIRTKDNIDAAEMARTFGGGGHPNAAGCRVNGYSEDIIDNIIKMAIDRLQ